MVFDYNNNALQLAQWGNTSTTDPRFLSALPNIIAYAENRIYRELDLLSSIVRDTTTSTTANSPNYTAPSAFIVITGLNLITPASTAPDSGTRNQLLFVSKEFIDYVWPTRATVGGNSVPRYAAMVGGGSATAGNQAVLYILAPTPGAIYTMEVEGTQRPTPLSAANTTTFLTNVLPDLFFAAEMVALTGYQRNFGAQAEDPQAAQSWEHQYQTLFASANLEEVRKKYQSADWTPFQPLPQSAGRLRPAPMPQPAGPGGGH